MHASGQTSLQSLQWLQTHRSDRPMIYAKISRVFSTRDYVVFAMQHGLLFLEHLDHPMSVQAPGGVNGAVVAGAIMGGALGALAAAAATSGGGGHVAAPRKESGLETKSDDELFALARSRKRSFVVERDDVQSVLIDAPGFFSSLWGTVTIRDRRLGTLSLGIPDRSSMAAALDAFPRHYGSQTKINVCWDEGKRTFVKR